MARAAKGEGSVVKRGDRFQGYVTVDGKRKYFSATTKAEAATKRRMLLAQRDNGQLTAGKVPTLGEWLDHWLTISEERLAPTTFATYRGYINSTIKPALGSTRLDRLTIDQLDRFYAQLAAEGKSGSTRHQAHSIIRVALKHAVWRGHVGRNVAALVQPPASSKPKTEALSVADMIAIEHAAAGTKLEARWMIALGLGLRPGEATALEWRHIDFDNNTITVEQQLQQIHGKGLLLRETTKTSAGRRVIPMPGYIADALRRRRQAQLQEMQDSDWQPFDMDGPRAFVFTQHTGRPYGPRLDAARWAQLLQTAGLPHQRRYIARHSAASYLLAHGVDEVTAAEILGHQSSAFTRARYVHSIDERVKAVADVLDRGRLEREKW